ncbi:hypothetical protein COCON_G00003830 [Conger conger]|uniref:Uncharacterized protein n=1 Tax=Conger conger TaxID=82655 RepID=A0A9Q1E1Q4_CONCO|nr:hypothetical protein COCON_G00003830 [Conger conger]
MTLKILLLVACILVTITEQNQGVAEWMPDTAQVSTTTQSTCALSAQSDTKRPPKDKSQVLKTGQKKTGCYCNGKWNRRLKPGCRCKQSPNPVMRRTSKAVKKNPLKRTRNPINRRRGTKRISRRPISTPI